MRLPALACLRACPSPTSGIVCSTPTYLRSRLPLRVEAHAGLLAGTRKRAVKFGSGPETGGGDAESLADGRRSPHPPLGFLSALSFPVASKGANLLFSTFRCYPQSRSDVKSTAILVEWDLARQ